MIIDLSCPLEVRSYELLHDDNGNTRAYIQLYNLSDKRVVGYNATANWFCGLTQARATNQLTIDECLIEPTSMFKLQISVPHFADADHVELYFSAVVFEDGTGWYTQGDTKLVDIGERKALDGQTMNLLKSVAGGDAVQFPQQQGEMWRCVCGRVNPMETDTCWRCARGREDVFKNCNRKAVFARVRSQRADKRRQDAQSEKKTDIGALFLKSVLALLILILLAIIGYRIGRGGNETDVPPEKDTVTQTDILPSTSAPAD